MSTSIDKTPLSQVVGPARRTFRRRPLAIGLTVALSITVIGSAAPANAEPTSKPSAHGDLLGGADRGRLAQAQLRDEQRVTVMIATERGQTASVVRSLQASGAWLGTVNNKLGYVRASVLADAVERVAGLARVTAIDLDAAVPIDRPTVGPTSRPGSAPAAAPGPKTPDANPYMPTQDTGSIDFRKKNPTYDGRGVTIGIVDSGVDLDHPALQTTTTGERKIVDWVTGTDPLLDGDESWRPMTTKVTATPQFSAVDQTWTAPRSGAFAFATFEESITELSEPRGDINRDGDTSDSFGILYDAATNDIWVDANQDNAFTAAELMRPYKEKFQIGHFGTDNPATAVVERSPFVVEYREDVDLAPLDQTGTADFVNIGLVQDAHGSHIAGIAAAHSLFGGAMNGQAPGARLVSSRACGWDGGCTEAALLDGMVDLVTQRGVDVVNVSIGGLPEVNDGNNARATIYDRLIADYGVQLFVAAGNSGPGINTVEDPSVTSTVVSVGSSISQQTWRANYGAVVAAQQALHPFSSRGPTEAGGFKPDLVAPGSAISTVPQWLEQTGIAETGYTLPVGYAMFNGTSMASPQAAGSAALLLSAAAQTERPVTPRHLRDVLTTTARLIDGVAVTGQGSGLIDVPTAWKLLQKSAATSTYSTDAPVCSPLADQLARPDRGTGVYNRCAPEDGGQQVGVAKSYDLTVTRSGGSARAQRHTVTIVGNDGTFAAPRSISLAAGSPTTLTVTATPTSTGTHAAYLAIDDPSTPVIDHRIPLTVMVGQPLAAPAYATSFDGSVQRSGAQTYSVLVPEGATSLQVDLTGIATRSQTAVTLVNPDGVPVTPTTCFTNLASADDCDPLTVNQSMPKPGIWEMTVQARRTTPVLDNPYRVTASVVGITFTPEEQTVPESADGAPTPLTWTATSTLGPVTVVPSAGQGLSSRTVPSTISEGERQTFTVDVPAGTTALSASFETDPESGADLDIAIFDPSGEQVNENIDLGFAEIAAVEVDAPGTYTIAVNGFSVPGGSVEYEYFDTYTLQGPSPLELAGGALTLTPGAPVTLTGHMRTNGVSVRGRQIGADFDLRSTRGAVLATATVSVGAASGRPR